MADCYKSDVDKEEKKREGRGAVKVVWEKGSPTFPYSSKLR